MGRWGTRLLSAGAVAAMALAAAGCASPHEVTCSEFVAEVDPSSGGHATPHEAVEAWSDQPPHIIAEDMEPTGWSLTSDGADVKVFSHGGSTLWVSMIDTTGTQEWFVYRGKICV